ncbi:ATP-binding cassette domain-containing protein [Bifidobacterium cuniculi]|uniref:ABC transporter ATP-binding protein n=1 Tax=Bifidobacterium cuniculi TaxID=1688 RepID=A0A087AZR5_9BIFI|nr:ATP-binding cassette domain-containing protein [Bifidobacterium cuniculi]KFI64265.1 ABC transporter ATP-binding protein [Bifidobacterium cuniculi]
MTDHENAMHDDDAVETPAVQYTIEYDDVVEAVDATADAMTDAVETAETLADADDADATADADTTVGDGPDDDAAAVEVTEVPAETAAEDSADTEADGGTDTAASVAAATDVATASRVASSLDQELVEEEDTAARDAVFRSYPLLALQHVTLAARGGGNLWEDLSLTFEEGRSYGVLVDGDDRRHAALVGLLTGLVTPSQGMAVMKTTNLLEIDPLALRGHRIGVMLPQLALRDDLTALQNVTNAMEASNRNFLKPMPTIARELLDATHFGEHDDEAAKPAHGVDTLGADLGPVDWHRAAIARTVCTDPEVVVADEPAADLSGEDVDEIVSLLQAQVTTPDRRRAVIVVTTDEHVAGSFDELVDLR